MADTYAFALGGALLLALTLAPVLCLLFFKNLKPVQDNFLVRFLKDRYSGQLKLCLNHRMDDRPCMMRPARWDTASLVPHAGPRVHAGAGRGQPVDSRHRSRSTSRWSA